MMRFGSIAVVSAVALGIAGPAQGQLVPHLPQIGGVIDRVSDGLPRAGDVLDGARDLAARRVERARDLARRHPDRVALDPDGNAVRAGELIVIDPDAGVTAAARARGFRLVEQVRLGELGVSYARFDAPRGMAIGRALKQLRAIAGGSEVSADQLYSPSGGANASSYGSFVKAPPGGGGPIGIIDGGVPPDTPGLARQQGFAQGGVRPDGHAVAIASLLTGGGGIRASAPGARLHVADVYGIDPAGGNAAAIGQALAWMARERVPVVVVSLTGPPNPLLERIVVAARRLGTVVVAAVGNDGPAARPAYPASYPGVIAVTGVDGRQRLLIEAGRALKVDYAAPGADLLAQGIDGRPRRVRGTSFAAPFVAARLSAHLAAGGIGAALAALDREARDLGKRGPDKQFGRGLICAECATGQR